jgi:hypothetical protein
MIKVSYLVHNPNWTEQEWEEQPQREFVITKKMIADLIDKHANGMNQSEYADKNNIHLITNNENKGKI